VKVYAACIDCEWRSGGYRSGVSYKGAVREGDAHHARTGHAVAVPKFAGGQRVISTREPDDQTAALGFTPADLSELVDFDE
jgi:hypothetical protein